MNRSSQRNAIIYAHELHAIYDLLRFLFLSSQTALWLRGLLSHYCKKKRICSMSERIIFVLSVWSAWEQRTACRNDRSLCLFTLRWIWCSKRVNWCLCSTLILIDFFFINNHDKKGWGYLWPKSWLSLKGYLGVSSQNESFSSFPYHAYTYACAYPNDLWLTLASLLQHFLLWLSDAWRCL